MNISCDHFAVLLVGHMTKVWMGHQFYFYLSEGGGDLMEGWHVWYVLIMERGGLTHQMQQ